MFRKPFRIKSNSLLKNSDKRKLRSDVHAMIRRTDHSDSSESLEWVNSMISLKQDIYLIRLSSHCGDVLSVYSCLGNPLLFQWKDELIPTVYTLWQYPQLLPCFTTWPLVLEKLQNGADLMLPGVVLKSSDPTELGSFSRGRITAVCLAGNRSAVAVGVTVVSSDDIAKNGMRGKGIAILHVYQDYLWEMGKKELLPNMPEGIDVDVEAMTLRSDLTNLDSDIVETKRQCDDTENVVEEKLDQHEDRDGEFETTTNDKTEDVELANDGEDGESSSSSAVDDMDSLFVWCFLCALRTKVRKSDLPLLTSTLYSEFMQQCCSADANLDVKKTKYKKFSKFLAEMQANGVVTIKQQSKGVDVITAIEWKHDMLTSFTVPKQEEKPVAATGPKAPVIEELWSPSATTLKILQPLGYNKGSIMSMSEVRQAVTEYVKRNGLVSERNKSVVVLDPVLCHMLSPKGTAPFTELKWDELMKKFFEKMLPCHRVSIHGKGTHIKKGVVKHVSISTALRTGNKTVTLVQGLETFGISPSEVAHYMQKKAAASTTVGDLPAKKGQLPDKEVLIQGDAVRLVSSLLIDQYGIPLKYIDGLDPKVRSGKRT